MLEEELENLDEIGIKLARLEDILKHRDDLDVSLCKGADNSDIKGTNDYGEMWRNRDVYI